MFDYICPECDCDMSQDYSGTYYCPNGECESIGYSEESQAARKEWLENIGDCYDESDADMCWEESALMHY